jgi:hypothetical protein
MNQPIAKPVVIAGCLIPWDGGTNMPVMLQLPDSGDWLLPIFSTEEKLSEAVPWMCDDALDEVQIKQIDDSEDFIKSVRESGEVITIALDPHPTPQGTTAFMGVFLEDEL